MSKKMKIGITGGIGSGKSLVAEFITEKGFPVLKADDIAKEIMLTDEVVKNKIIEAFGEESYNGDNLNNKYLADKIFSSEDSLRLMNSIVHPPVIKRVKDRMYEELESSDFIFVEAALLYEAKMQHLFDHVILVIADETLRIKRVMERDGVTEDEVKARMKGQWQDSAKQDKADFILKNEGSKEDFIKNIEFILQLLKRISLK